MLVAEPGDEKLALGSALTVRAGTALCWEALPPLQRSFGKFIFVACPLGSQGLTDRIGESKGILSFSSERYNHQHR